MEPDLAKTWRCETYTDRKTGVLVAVEIIPDDDLREHISSEDCDCLPVLEREGNAPRLVHHAFDGRDAIEEEGH